MTLRRKTFLVITITLAGLVLLLYVVLRGIMLNSFSTLESQIILQNENRAANALQDSAANMYLGLNDWSSWDDTYQFVLDQNSAFPRDNLADQTFWNLKVNLMVFVSSDNQIVFAKAVDLDTEWQDSIVSNFTAHLRSDETLLPLLTGNPTSGFLGLDSEPLLIASRPILHNDQSGPAVGTLIWVRHLNTQAVAELSESLRFTLGLAPIHSRDLPADFQTAQATLSSVQPQFVNVLDDNMISGYGILNDIYAQPALILKVAQDRAVYAQGQTSLNYFGGALLIVGVLFSAAVLLLLEKLVLAPLTRLSERVRYIGVNDDFSMRLPVSGNDELTQLAAAINTMLHTVNLARVAQQHLNSELENRVLDRTVELEHQKSQLQAIMDTMGEGLVYSVDGIITYVNRSFAN